TDLYQQPVTVGDYSDRDEFIDQEHHRYAQSQTKYKTELIPDTMNQTLNPSQNKPMESIRQLTNQPSKIMIAIYDYDPHVLSPNPDIDAELSFRSGEQITVYGSMDDDGFYYGTTKDGRFGLVPSNFLQSCTNDVNYDYYLNEQTKKTIPPAFASTPLSPTNQQSSCDYELHTLSTNPAMTHHQHRNQLYSNDLNNNSTSINNNPALRVQTRSNHPGQFQNINNYNRSMKSETS
ncbi:unnamed protein product, partial [Schistosoma turkestanicum]